MCIHALYQLPSLGRSLHTYCTKDSIKPVYTCTLFIGDTCTVQVINKCIKGGHVERGSTQQKHSKMCYQIEAKSNGEGENNDKKESHKRNVDSYTQLPSFCQH